MLSRLALAGVLLSLPLLAQDPPLLPAQTGTAISHPAGPPGPDLPPPPRGLFDSPHKHGMPEIPVGTSTIPQPDTPPAEVLMEGVQAAGDYTVFRNTDVLPSGASTSNVLEPHTRLADAANGLLTHNWSAARTSDGGQNWTRINPYSRFPASNGGFCCDQVVATGNGVTAWLLQYSKSALSGNRQRVAIARNPGEVGSDSWNHYIDFTPSMFGFSFNDWLDYPDIAASNQFFYFTSNVFDVFDNYRGTVIWRMRIADAQAGGSVSFSYISSRTGTTGFAPRLAQGAQGDMFIASHVNTARLRVIRYLDSSSNYQVYERDISSWTSGFAPAPGPDGKDWVGRADHRITAGYANDTEVGFAWHVGPRGRIPNNYTKLVRFRTSDLARVGELDLWLGNGASLMYPAAATNAYGHVAVVGTAGGGPLYPSTATLLDDDWETFNFMRVFAGGNSGPPSNEWGDYQSVARHPSSDQGGTFVATGYRMASLFGVTARFPEFVHFGREAYGPVFVALNVRSSPWGFGITTSADVNGGTSGTTPFLQSRLPLLPYDFTAPARGTIDNALWLFDRWAVQGSPTGGVILAPVGQRTYRVGNIGLDDDIVEARYVRGYVLDVRSTNPTSGLGIGVSPSDFEGNGNGSTNFIRIYRGGTAVTLTAPATTGCNPFSRWVVNGTPQTSGNRSVTVTLNANVTAVAEYIQITPGVISPLGAGCTGSNGLVPRLTITHNNGSCGPLQGTPTTYRVDQGPASALAVLQFGIRTDFNGPIPLPWDLTPLGAPGCILHHELLFALDFATDASGNGAVIAVSPVDRSAVGFNWHVSATLLDLGNNSLNIVQSNALRIAPGGAR